MSSHKTAVARPASLKHKLQQFCGVLAIAAMVIVLQMEKDSSPLIVGSIVCIVYLFSIWIINLIFRFFAFKNISSPDATESPMLRNITLDFISRIYMPVLICDKDGRIVWYNNALSLLFHTGEVLYGRYIEQYCTANIDALMNADAFDGLPVGVLPAVHARNHTDTVSADLFTEKQDSDTVPLSYRVKGYPIHADGKEYCITFWNDKADLLLMQKQLEKQVCVVGFILIDNLDELVQFVRDQSRLASARVQSILTEWVKSMNGLIREVDRNKYLVLFEAQYLPVLLENRFSVMDEIRSIRVDEGDMPITVSMGIAYTQGSLSDKENIASEALDLALQRGGDQVVYKTANGTEFYGGRTKSVQKRTKVRSRVVAGKIVSLIKESSNVLIMGHRFSDHDSIGACIGIYKLVQYCGVRANIVLDFNDANAPLCLSHVMGREEYTDVFVDAPSALDYVASDTLLIICDVSNPEVFYAPELYENVQKCIVIDHHRKTGDFKYKPTLVYIEPSASSASELVAEMLEQILPLGSLPKEEADILLSGILIDTNQFSRNTGVRTFSAALYLRSEGANPADAKMLLRQSLDDFIREAKFASDIVIYRDIIAIAAKDTDNTTPEERIAAAKTADKLLSVGGVMAAFALVRIGNAIHISARSQGNMNVQLILEHLNGGGHFDAAGALLKNTTMQSALEQLKAVIDSYFNENRI